MFAEEHTPVARSSPARWCATARERAGGQLRQFQRQFQRRGCALFRPVFGSFFAAPLAGRRDEGGRGVGQRSDWTIWTDASTLAAALARRDGHGGCAEVLNRMFCEFLSMPSNYSLDVSSQLGHEQGYVTAAMRHTVDVVTLW